MTISPKKICISRTDNIGDVILTIPMAGILKKEYPGCEIYFIGKSYTESILACSEHIDHFINYDLIINESFNNNVHFFKNLNIDLFIHVFPNKELAKIIKTSNVPYRLGTKNRLYHWGNCNLRPALSRKKSNLHEAQLNIKLLTVLEIKTDYNLDEISNYYGFTKIPIEAKCDQYLDQSKKNIILHPRSLGSAREWGLNNFSNLIELLPKDEFNIIITGTTKEAETFEDELLEPFKDVITNTTGKLTLNQLISLISKSDGLIAASTGPLHIASACGSNALGLYIMTPPMHPGRWQPVGRKADYIVNDEKDLSLDSIEKISPEKVYNKILKWN